MNIKVLNSDELKYMIDNYKFEIVNANNTEFVSVVTKNYPNRITLHPTNKSFVVSNKYRKMIVSSKAISLWKNYFSNRSLLEVQNAANMLLVTYQDLDKDKVKKAMDELYFKMSDETDKSIL